MSVASELSALNGYILGAYDEINGKGGTVPANKNMANLASAISSISSGTPTTITPLQVTENGTYTAPTGTAYSPVTVNVSGGGGASFGDWVVSSGVIVPDETISSTYSITLPTNEVTGVVASGPATAIFMLALELPPYATISNYYTSILRAMANYNIKRVGSGYTSGSYISNFSTSGSITTNTSSSGIDITYLRTSEIVVQFGCTSSRRLLSGCSYRWMSFVKSKTTE